jgi:pyruvate kinase
MLSGETAVGKFPVQVIQQMTNIIKEIEVRDDIYYKDYPPSPEDPNFGSNRIVESACNIAHVMDAQAIIAMTMSGFTAYKVARHRPKAHIYVFTAQRSLLTRMSLVWGVRAFHYDKYISNDHTFQEIEEMLVKEGLLRKGDTYINTASMPMQERRKTNMLKISVVE